MKKVHLLRCIQLTSCVKLCFMDHTHRIACLNIDLFSQLLWKEKYWLYQASFICNLYHTKYRSLSLSLSLPPPPLSLSPSLSLSLSLSLSPSLSLSLSPSFSLSQKNKHVYDYDQDNLKTRGLESFDKIRNIFHRFQKIKTTLPFDS